MNATGGGPPAGPTADKVAATTEQHRPGQGSRSPALLVAHALVLLAGPHAVFDRLLVRICPVPGCAYSHLHHVPAGAWRQPLIRAPRCRPHLRYRIEVGDVLPAVPALTGQRRRVGAA